MHSTHVVDVKPALAVSLELSCGSWRTASTDCRRDRPATHKMEDASAGQRLRSLIDCIEGLKAKWGLPQGTQVVLIYEAGHEGFWIARALRERGWQVIVVEPASIPVARHARRAKTDRLDAQMLLEALLGWLRGERGRLREVKVPAAAAEALRQLVRDRGVVQKEIGQHLDRMRKLLRTVGCWHALDGDVASLLPTLRTHDDQPLPPELVQRLQREVERMQLAAQQLSRLEKMLRTQLPQSVQQMIGQLSSIRGVGWVGAMRLVLELFWRDFQNRRQVGACLGLVPQPYSSGESERDQGISKQGNRRVRALMIQMAWMWLRHQPGSAIAKWFGQRAGNASKRVRRIAIVAVARRLAIGLWRFLTAGVVPEGAVLKPA